MNMAKFSTENLNNAEKTYLAWRGFYRAGNNNPMGGVKWILQTSVATDIIYAIMIHNRVAGNTQ